MHREYDEEKQTPNERNIAVVQFVVVFLCTGRLYVQPTKAQQDVWMDIHVAHECMMLSYVAKTLFFLVGIALLLVVANNFVYRNPHVIVY
jgi:hypothetical protein